MKILKVLPDDEQGEKISQIFDSVIRRFEYPLKFDSMEVQIRDENKVILRDNTCLLVIDYNDSFVQQKDGRGTAVTILRLLFKAIVKRTYGELPEEIEDVIANREMIRKGYENDLVYYYYNKTPCDISWISFYLDDRYNSSLLKRAKTKMSQQVMDHLKKDLDKEENLEKALRVMGCK